MLLDRLGRAVGQLRPVEPALAVDVRGDVQLAHERPVGARGDRDVGAAGEREHAERVVGRLLERLVAGEVVTPTSSSSGLASASSSAIASSCPGSQSRMTRGRHRASIASTSAAVGSDGCAPKRDAASAPAAHARRSASSRLAALEQRDEQAGGERVAGGGAVDGVDLRRLGARDLLAVLEQHRALGAERDGDEAVAPPSASSS